MTMAAATTLKSQIFAYALSLGFERVGITSAESLSKEQSFIQAWVEDGRAGGMDYLKRDPASRARPKDRLPEAKSIIALAFNYHTDPAPKNDPNPLLGTVPIEQYNPLLGTVPRSGFEAARFGRYAWGKDYHKVLGKRLEALVRYLEAVAPEGRYKTFLDTGALLERPFAQRAGLGFIGKNTMLITKGLGSWVFLAHVITSLELTPDAPDTRNCGECRLCIDACPTGALTAPYEMDARRCISYLTIENRGEIPAELRAKTEGWVLGCDICQDVCPHNTRIPSTREPSFQPFWGDRPVTLEELLSLRSEKAFTNRFAGTAVTRARWEGLLRNACVAAANLERKDLLPLLRELSASEVPELVREHATWAIEQLECQS
jgi:epoxyqueuosine reductase